ncbi:MAG: hypothetical protein ACREL5_10370, partial [Gemmatimonadales bacterium]
MASPLVFHLIFHTHWDREWYQTEAAFRPRLHRAVTDLATMLARDDDARFVLDGQTVLLDDAIGVEPELADDIAGAVRRSQLEIGPWYILADELIPSGESLIRNLLEGATAAERIGGRMDVLYSPDAVGHPSILPILAREFGIERALVWRGAGDAAERDLWSWSGPDHRSVTLHVLPPQGYELGAVLACGDPARHWGGIRDRVVARAVTSQIAVFLGADHHAAPDDELAIRDGIQALESGNFVRISSLSEYFDAVEVEACPLEVVAREFRDYGGGSWLLQGVHGTRLRLKRRFSQVERALLRRAEPLAAMARWWTGVDLRPGLHAARVTLLQCQFHDTICGTMSDDVAREQEVRLASVAAIADEIATDSLHRLSSHDPDRARDDPSTARPAVLLWNPGARRRSGIVVAEMTAFRRSVPVGPPSDTTIRTGSGYIPGHFVTDDGGVVPVQVLDRSRAMERIDARHHYPALADVDRVRVAMRAVDLPGLGLRGYLWQTGRATPPAQGLDAENGRVANSHVEIHVDQDGRVLLIDRRTGEHYRDVLAVCDQGDTGDCYTPHLLPGISEATCRPPTLIAGGPLVAAIESRFAIQRPDGRIAGRRVIVLYADSPIVRVHVEFDNEAVDHRLRLRLPVGVGDFAIAGAAFGFETRESGAAAPSSADERPVATSPAHRFVGAAAGSRGLVLLSPGFCEYEWTGERELYLTLSRSVGELSRDTLTERPGHAAWPVATPGAQEHGRHAVDVAVVPVTESEIFDVPLLESFWEDAFAPIQATFIRDYTGSIDALPRDGVELEGTGLVFSAAKPSEDGSGIVLRCYNADSSGVSGRWMVRAPAGLASAVRADERRIAPLPWSEGVIDFTVPARGIFTVRVDPG